MNNRSYELSAEKVGLGLAALGRPAYINAGRGRDLPEDRSVEAMRSLAAQVMDAAYTLGVRYFDVARSYGLAEEFLASWLADHPEINNVEVGSKWGYRYVGGWAMDAAVHEVKDHSAQAFFEQLVETQTLLGDRLNVYHIHSATQETGVLRDREVLAALSDLRETGVRVGLSTSGPNQSDVVREAVQIEVAGQPLFTSVQTTWNLLEPSSGVALAEAAEAGARVIIKEALANGRLAPQSDGAAHPLAGGVHQLAGDQGISIDQLAMAAALAQPWAWRVLSGAVTPAQVRSNVAAATLRVPPDVWRKLQGAALPPAQYWVERSERVWG
jgi:aryl-alcohol dehydrogenase-like predicted oxidoreductase